MEDQGPMIKFQQIRQQVAQKDKQSAIAAASVSENYIAVGTYTGSTEVFDADSHKCVDTYLLKNGRVSGLSFDSTGKYLLVSHYAKLLSFKNIDAKNQQFKTQQTEKEILASAIDPFITQTSEAPELSCVFSDIQSNIIRVRPKKSIFSSTTSSIKVISQEQDTIDNIVWKGDIICWASGGKFTIYSAKNEQKIMSTTVERPRDNFRSCFEITPNEVYVSIAGSNYVVNLQAQQTKKLETDNRLLFATNGKGDKAFLMYKNLDAAAPMNSLPSETSLIYLRTLHGSEEYKCDIPKEQQTFLSGSFHSLFPLGEQFVLTYQTFLFLVSFSKLSERIEWFLSKQNVERACQLLDENIDSLDVDEKRKLVDSISLKQIEQGKLPNAVITMYKYIGTEYDHMYQFFKLNNLLHIFAENAQLQYIPVESIGVDEMTDILRDFIENGNIDKLKLTLEELDTNRYNADVLYKSVEGKLKSSPEYKVLLMLVCFASNDYRDKGFETALEIKYDDIFTRICQFENYEYVTTHLFKFYSTYGADLIAFLLENGSKYEPGKVLDSMVLNASKMKYTPEKGQRDVVENFTLDYLDHFAEADTKEVSAFLNYKGPNQTLSYGTQLAGLYLKYNHPNAIRFLEHSTDFDYTYAKTQAMFWHRATAAAYLCRKTGDTLSGIQVLLDTKESGYQGDPDEAINYANIVDDVKVWKMLKAFSYKNLKYLHAILKKLPELHLNPVTYIQEIPSSIPVSEYIADADIAIKGFQRKLVTAQLTHDIVAKDAFGAFQRCFSSYKKGKPIDSNH